MAGINVVSASSTNTDQNDTTVDNYVTDEQVTLSTTPTSSSYQWSLSKPTTSTDRCQLSDETAAAPKFVPDVAGYYALSVTVADGSVYTVTISVLQVVMATALEALRFQPMHNAAVVTPPAAGVVFWSLEVGGLAVKLADGTVHALNVT